jgi:predicted phosphodiesterase
VRIGLIADIHGNHVALVAALADLETRGVDEVVCLGDVAATGPQPSEVVRSLRSFDCRKVMGNADAFILDPKGPPPDDPDFARIVDMDVWVAEQLSAEDLAFIGSFEPTVAVDVEGLRLLCFHGTPSSYDAAVHAWSSPDDLDRAIGSRDEELLAGGHTHFQFVRRHRRSTWINPGTIGLAYHPAWPLEEARNAAFAEYAVVDVSDGVLSIDAHRVPYEREEVIDAILKSGMPHADWWAGAWQASST